MTTTTIADEATILARVAEAHTVYPLPTPRYAHPIIDRAAAFGPDVSDTLRAAMAKEPPFLHIRLTSPAEVSLWATHLGLDLETRVERWPDSSFRRETRAVGNWLGWRVSVSSDHEEVDLRPTRALLRRAHLGTL